MSASGVEPVPALRRPVCMSSGTRRRPVPMTRTRRQMIYVQLYSLFPPDRIPVWKSGIFLSLVGCRVLMLMTIYVLQGLPFYVDIGYQILSQSVPTISHTGPVKLVTRPGDHNMSIFIYISGKINITGSGNRVG